MRAITVSTGKVNELLGCTYPEGIAYVFPNGEVKVFPIEAASCVPDGPQFKSMAVLQLTSDQVARLILSLERELHEFRDAAVKFF